MIPVNINSLPLNLIQTYSHHLSAAKKATILSIMIGDIEKKLDSKVIKGSDPDFRYCDWPSCKLEGMHRAPKSQEKMREYNWFCLKHVRIYNNSWNYYEGISEEDINAIIRSDTTWNRPTWPLGYNHKNISPDDNLRPSGAGDPRANYKEFNDPFGFFTKVASVKGTAEKGSLNALSVEERKSLLILGFDDLVQLSELKTRYKMLVKKYHPDITGGNKKLEERFKQINAAYKIVRTQLMNN